MKKGFSLVLIIVSLVSLVAQEKPSYFLAKQELILAWDKLYPLPFAKIILEDPLRKGIQPEKRKDNRRIWIYNFTVFMPKYDRNSNAPTAREEGRDILVYFLWEPTNKEDPYRIQLGELSGNL